MSCSLFISESSSADEQLLDSWRIFPIGMDAREMCAADFGGDGSLDIAAVSRKDSVAILLNNGDGTFGDAASYWTAAHTWSVDAADFDGDGDIDLVVGVSHPVASTAVMLNDGNGTFRLPMFFGLKGDCQVVRSADFDNDGLPDIATIMGGKVDILYNQGDSTFSQPLNATYQSRLNALVAMDLDNDGDVDPATTDYGLGRVFVVLNGGAGRFEPAVSYGVGARPGYLAATDFDGDGMFTPTTIGKAAMYLSDCSFLDIDNDGNNDLAILFYSSYVSGVGIMINDGGGVFRNPIYFGGGEALTTADLDGDGDLDFAAIGRSAVTILFNLADIISDADYDDPPALPLRPALYQNHPNPFNPPP